MPSMIVLYRGVNEYAFCQEFRMIPSTRLISVVITYNTSVIFFILVAWTQECRSR